jgi:purine nucleoside permease
MLALVASASVCSARPRPIPVKVVVVAMFEVGNDTGHQPGEFQYWVERRVMRR